MRGLFLKSEISEYPTACKHGALGTVLAFAVAFVLAQFSVEDARAQGAPPAAPTITELNGTPVSSPGRFHDFTQLPLTRDGWTDLHSMIMSPGYADARIVYVSANGNDSTGQVYTPSSSAVGGRPLDPAGSIQAFRTLGAAYDRLRPGYPDVLLLRRGDSWETSTLRVTKAGRNSAERMIVAAYGPESTARPVVRVAHSDTGARHVILSSMHNRFSGSTTVDFRGDNVLVEDFYWDSPPGSDSQIILPILNGGSSGFVGGGVLRRSAASWTVFFAGNWGGAAQTPSLFEENSICRNSGPPYSAIYFSEGALNITMLRNQVVLTGNAGLRNRDATAPIRENLVVGMQPQFTFGGGFDVHHFTEFSHNVGMHVPGPHALIRPRNAIVRENIFTAFSDNGFSSMINMSGAWNSFPGASGNTVIERNIFRMDRSSGAISWDNLIDSLQTGALVAVRQNVFLKPAGGRVTEAPDDSRLSFESNRYFSTSPTTTWFSGRSYSSMVPATGTVTSMEDFPDPDRNILTYMRSIGASPSSVDQAMEWYCDGVPGNSSLAGARENRRGAWDQRFVAIAVINYVREGFGLPRL